MAADSQGPERLDPAPLAALEDPEDGKAQAESRERRPDEVEPRTTLRARSGLQEPARQQDHDHDHGLAREDEPPTQVVVTQPPINGPAAIAAPATPPMIP